MLNKTKINDKLNIKIEYISMNECWTLKYRQFSCLKNIALQFELFLCCFPFVQHFHWIRTHFKLMKYKFILFKGYNLMIYSPNRNYKHHQGRLSMKFKKI